MKLYAILLAALAARIEAVAVPYDGRTAAIDPSDGLLPPQGITDACTNMFTQPNATPKTYENVDKTYGLGKYKAWYSTDASLPDHTIYLPKEIPEGVKMPVILWANGGCGATGTAWMSPLIEWASHGIMVIADGSPSGSGRDTSALLKKSLDWLDTIGSNPKYAFVDITRVGVAGQSCGGLLAYDLEGDKRIKTVGIFNSGALNAQQQKMPPNFTKPIAYFLGGSSDIAYKQGTSDYKSLPKSLPAWKGNVESGHGGTYCRPAGGEYGKAGTQWWRWHLRGDESGKTFFTGEGARNMGWQAVQQNLDKAVTPESLPGN